MHKRVVYFLNSKFYVNAYLGQCPEIHVIFKYDEYSLLKGL